MSEQYPLLCDEVSEEERLSPRCRQLRMSRARAKNHVKGAAAIIARWPGQWTTLLNYWWIGIGMIAITTYLLYNCLFTYVMLETTNQSYPRPYNTKLKLDPPIKPSLPPKVFMHIFAEDKQEVDLNNYLPYIDIITKKYKHFKYQLIIVANDTNSETKDLSFQESNKLALNSLWYDSDNNKNTNSNLHIKYTTLSNCFYDSPLEKFWKNLPQQFLKFLVRAVSIWEKGGIAFDPIALTPQSPNSIYIDKIYRILKKHNLKNAKVLPKPYKSIKKMNKAHKHLPNNIRDVINALENDNGTEKSLQDPLDEVETKDKTTVVVRRQRSVADIIGPKNETKQLKLKETQNIESVKKTEPNRTQEKKSDGTPKFNLLPMFLKYLFHVNEIKYPDDTTPNSELIKHADEDLQRNVVIRNENKTQLERDIWDAFTVRSHRNPTTVTVKGIVENPENELNHADVTEREIDNLFEITIDLKGNVIATDTACHAFIGGMFSNAIHHDYIETISEFIIKELTIFCKGLFSSCVGIDVILF